MTTYPLLAVQGLDKTTPAFREQLVAGALQFGLDPGFIAAVMAFESGFNPKAVNKSSGARGLIQWIDKPTFDDTAKRAGSSARWEDLPNLTAEQQLPIALAWFDNKPLLKSSKPADYYLAVWSPAYIGKPNDYVVANEGSTVYEQNSGFDKTGKGYITIADVVAPVTAIVSAGLGRPALPVPLVGTTPRDTLLSPGVGSSLRLPPPPRLPTLSAEERSFAGLPLDLPPLELGNHGTAVMLLQQLLNQTSSADHPLVVDGDYGTHTESAVGLHQIWFSELVTRSERLDPTGIVNDKTWASFLNPAAWQKENAA